jgi:hypothetical protein
MEKRGAKGAANALGFKGGVAGIKRDTTGKGSKQLGRAAEGGVWGKQIGKEIKATGFEIAST